MLTAPEVTHNQLTYSVSEISGAVKRLVEDNFGHVRVRGEISGWKVASSGHAYPKLKDANSVLEAVCWRGVIGKLPFRPEDGMEVICSGRLTTYPGSSKYQLVIDFIEPAGVGALMALLEKRKTMLAAEGLFDAKRKKPLPFMPQVIGVVTSPTGAVIRDILHRLRDRFPCHVIVWGVSVQGEGAAGQIARAIEGFNAIGAGVRGGGVADDLAGEISRSETGGGARPRKPDLIIVARGGGSLEDLWAFNEEIVVRAAAASRIPLISAVGHETDTTLIDYASDRRAPTPTAAAEMAVPVREEWLLSVMDQGKRILMAVTRHLQTHHEKVSGLARGLPNTAHLLDAATQRLDDWSERHTASLSTFIVRKTQLLAVASARLQPHSLMQNIHHHETKLGEAGGRIARIILRNMNEYGQRFTHIAQLFESLNYKRVLLRGFVLVRDKERKVISRTADVQSGQKLELEFYDGVKMVTA